MHLPRFLLAATSSGSGKTLLTCGILQALINRGKRVASFKCGPDYIDPMFHMRVVGTRSRNLDTYFTDEEMTRYLLARDCEDVELAVMEGVMGFYDGIGVSTQASSYDLARVTSTPVVLLVNGKGMSLSMVSMIEGMIHFREDANIQGVILNQVSQSTYGKLKDLIEKECKVRVLGYVPNVQDYVTGNRHLGLKNPEEIAEIRDRLNSLASILENCIDIDGLIRIADQAPHFYYHRPELPRLEKTIRVGIARDEAFCFYYEDNLELLRDMGAELVEFSPIRDEHLPEGIQALVLGGGYPEVFAEKLSANVIMREEIRQALESGLPCVAECGGFMYLHDEMEDMKRFSRPMVGFVRGRVYQSEAHGHHIGYIELTAAKDQMLGAKGTTIKAHEYHYFGSTDCGNSFHARKPSCSTEWECMHGTDTFSGGFPHLYYYSNPQAAFEFLKKGSQYVIR